MQARLEARGFGLGAMLIASFLAMGTPASTEQAPTRVANNPALATFADFTRRAGINFRHTNGAFGKKYLPETMGSGCAFLDYDEDGWQDMFLVNSTSWPGRPPARSASALYRNNRDGTFSDVTARVGLGVEFYGMGVAAADFDNDDWTDIFVTGLGQSRLFKNLRGERFADVTSAAGLTDSGFATSAMWFDYDVDGRLDLFVAHYVEWAIGQDLFCTLDGTTKSYCTPESYKGQSGRLWRNRGDGTFEDVTKRAGLFDSTAKALGVALLDYNADGRMDVFVANDKQPNRLYENRGNGTFIDVAVSAGVAFNEAGVARAGMGVDAGDYDGSGRPSLVIGNFSNEMLALYTNEGKGLFIDEAPASALGPATLLSLTFGCFFFDYDLDGRLDIFTANGHVADDISRIQPKVTYAQPPHLFRNLGGRKFASTSSSSAALRQPLVGRGAAFGDIDNDGDLDVLVTENNGPARLLRNDGGNASRWLRVKLIGGPANRHAIGSTVTLTLSSGDRQIRLVKTGSSYLSQSELPVTFGLGATGSATEIRVTWPGGASEVVKPTGVNRLLVIQQGKGLLPP
ncbi:MAG: CRTAC1 family protein [Vicinamibacterales bacterium]